MNKKINIMRAIGFVICTALPISSLAATGKQDLSEIKNQIEEDTCLVGPCRNSSGLIFI